MMAYYDMLLHVDQNDAKFLKMAFRSAANYFNALPDQEFEFDIIVTASAVLLLSRQNTELRDLALRVLQKGVKLKVCANALRENRMSPDEIWPECVVVPAGLVEIAKLQKSGFAYVKP